MWDQNPMLHKLTLDDLERDYRATLQRQRNAKSGSRIVHLATTYTVIVATILVVGANLV